jgi:hypothetical protein
VERDDWYDIVAALDANRCHGFMRSIELPAELTIDADDAAELLAATDGFPRLRSLQCGGAGVETLIDAVGGRLRRLELRDCSATPNIDFTRMPLLRHIGTVRKFPPGVTVIDLSHLQHLTRIGDVCASGCRGVREVRLPPSVTAIDENFLAGCPSVVADLSRLSQLRIIGRHLMTPSNAPNVRLPPHLAAIVNAEIIELLAQFLSAPEAATIALLRDIERILVEHAKEDAAKGPAAVPTVLDAARLYLRLLGHSTTEQGNVPAPATAPAPPVNAAVAHSAPAASVAPHGGDGDGDGEAAMTRGRRIE